MCSYGDSDLIHSFDYRIVNAAKQLKTKSMHSLYEIKSKGIQTPISNTLGSFNFFIESKYFSQKVELIFINQNNNKTTDNWNWLLEQVNEFTELNANKIGWIKSKLWVNYLYAIEATDYGFEEIPISQMNIDFKIEEITILDDMPTANLETIRFNMNHFKIYKESQVLEGSKLELVEFRDGSIIFNFSTVWDDEHDVSVITNNYIFEDIE